MNQIRLSVTQSLIIINVVVFLAGLYAQQNAIFCIPTPEGEPSSIFHIYGAYTWYNTFVEGEIWRLISYQFCHAHLGHLVFNMWALYIFGPAVEYRFGARRYMLIYFLCGVAGALLSSLLSGIGLVGGPVAGTLNGLEIWQFIPLVGASAAIYGVLVSTAFLFPHAQISLLFPPVTLKLRTLAMIVTGISIFYIIGDLNNAGGEAGHLGGIVMGAMIMLLIKHRYLRW